MNPSTQTADVNRAKPPAIATVVAYRALAFWPLVPAGWVVWWRLDKGRPVVGPPGNPRDQNRHASSGTPASSTSSSSRAQTSPSPLPRTPPHETTTAPRGPTVSSRAVIGSAVAL